MAGRARRSLLLTPCSADLEGTANGMAAVLRDRVGHTAFGVRSLAGRRAGYSPWTMESCRGNTCPIHARYCRTHGLGVLPGEQSLAHDDADDRTRRVTGSPIALGGRARHDRQTEDAA